jgi:hypothetical protein
MADHEHVDPQVPGRNHSPMDEADAVEPRPGPVGSPGHAACYWNDKQYSDGATVCESHTLYECWNGRWVAVDQC